MWQRWAKEIVSRVPSWPGNKSGSLSSALQMSQQPFSTSSRFMAGSSTFDQPNASPSPLTRGLLGLFHPPNLFNCPDKIGGGPLSVVPVRGLKIKGRVNRRCKDCYLIWEDGILYNRCKTHQRHKQMLKPMYWANSRLLTHRSMPCTRPWSVGSMGQYTR